MRKKTFSKETRAIIWVVCFIALFLVVVYSVKYIYPAENTNKYKYNHFDFEYYDGTWYTMIQLNGQPWKVPLRYGPKDVEHIMVIGDPNIFLKLKANYITFDPESKDMNYTALAASELSLNLAQALNITPLGACTKNTTESCYDRTIINCETDKTHAIIYLTQNATFPSVEQKDNCLIIKGKGFDLVKAVDRLLLYWYKIMPQST